MNFSISTEIKSRLDELSLEIKHPHTKKFWRYIYKSVKYFMDDIGQEVSNSHGDPERAWEEIYMSVVLDFLHDLRDVLKTYEEPK